MPPSVDGQPGLKSNASLMAEGNAVQRPQFLSLHHCAFGRRRPRASIVEPQINQRVEAGIAELDAPDGGFQHLDRRQVPAADAEGEIGRTDISELIGGNAGD
jgi:hypothetical protein